LRTLSGGADHLSLYKGQCTAMTHFDAGAITSPQPADAPVSFWETVHGPVTGYGTAGGVPWWGKRRGWLKCIDASRTGDITGSGEVWSYALSRETCSTPAVYAGMVFVADCGGTVHCVDAATGKPCWTYKADGAIWGSPLVADGKVYIGTRAGEFDVLAATREKRLSSSTQVGEPISATATAANGTLYVPTMAHLYAVALPGQ